MKEMFNYILNNYLKAKDEKFKENIMADYLREKISNNIANSAKIDQNIYKIYGSPGKGRWADIPWIAIFDKEITETAQEGYDIVYLFCADMSGFYISLNQGWTYFKKKYKKDAIKKIECTTNAWKKILSSTLNDFSFDKINLKSKNTNSDLAKGYELGHICGKFYEFGKIPEDEELEKDLIKLMGVYRELKGNMKENDSEERKNTKRKYSTEKTNNFLIVNNELGLLNELKEKSNSGSLDNIIETLGSDSVLIEEVPPEEISSKDDEDISFNPKKTDFIKKAKNHKKLGLAGELMVIKYEKEKLIASGKKELAKKVRHVSMEDGDGAGYDILSYEIDGNKKFIEVKTTRGNKRTPFIVTATEMKFSEINESNYYLYRIFEFDSKSSNGKLYILKGSIAENVNLKPQQYVSNGLK